MDFPGSGAGDTLQHCSATSGMRVAPMEDKANATQHLNGGVSGDWIILEKGILTSSDFAGSRMGSKLQPYSATSGMLAAPIEERSTRRLEQSCSQEREGVQAVPQYVCMELSYATQELNMWGVFEQMLQTEEAHHLVFN